jgi:hypothetical protein
LLIVALLIGVLVLSTLGVAIATPGTHVKADGDYAWYYYNGTDLECLLDVTITVSRTDEGALLTYDLEAFDGSTYVWEAGEGTVPGSALSASANAVRLRVDTAAVDGFTLTAGEGGFVDLTFSPDGFYTHVTSGRTSSTFQGTLYEFVGTRTGASAEAEGTAFGWEVPRCTTRNRGGDLGTQSGMLTLYP